jgi:H+/Cl- antiporter ClcA
METNKDTKGKKGFTVSELEGKAKQYASEIGLAVIFFLTPIFTLVWGSSMKFWAILLCMIFAILGAVIPHSMMDLFSKALDFVYREKVMLIATGIVLMIIGIFIPAIIFALVGLIAGGALSQSMKNRASKETASFEAQDD